MVSPSTCRGSSRSRPSPCSRPPPSRCAPPSERPLSALAKSWSASSDEQRLLAGAAGLFLVSLTLLALGSVVLYRYDLWPAALTVAGLAAVLARRERLGFAALGLGVAAKA